MMERETTTTDRFAEEPAGMSVLIISADRFARKFLSRGLQRVGYAAITASDPAAAERVLRTRSIAAVLLDDDIPEGSTHALAQVVDTVWSGSEDPPVLMVVRGRDSRLAGRIVGFADRCLVKPLEIGTLVAAIEAHLSDRVSAKEPDPAPHDPEHAVTGPTAVSRRSVDEIEGVGEILVEALDSIDQGFVVWDRADRLVICNERFRRLFGSNACHVVAGAAFEDLMRRQVDLGAYWGALAGSREWLEQRISRHRDPQGPFDEEFSDGTWIRVAENRTSSGYTVALYTDVSDARRREIALKTFAENNRRLAAAVNATSSAILITDPNRPGNPTVFANPAFTEMTGWPVEEALGRDRSFLNGPETDPAEACRFQQDMRAGRQTATELLLRSRSGRAFRARLSASPIRGSDGRISNWVIVQTELTRDGELEIGSSLSRKIETIGRLTG